ncbi:hypothetical protein, partial [Stenotrophomonas maltophilia group sp. RNC7]|uniref:hypothetical protein n=1 Tax=Stenotrophomonas maltophilia group sp. RNC7 TaxID=3071467 RepID=UPI0027E1A140
SNTYDYERNFKIQHLFRYYSSLIEKINSDIVIENPPKDMHLLKDASHLDITRGNIELTPLGESFASICC